MTTVQDYPDLLRDAAIKGAYKTVEWAVKKGYKWTNPTGDFDPCTDLENFELLLKCGFVVTQHTFRLAILWEKRDVLICLKRYGYKCNDENFARAIDTNYEVAWWLKYFMGPFDKELETKFFLCETKKWMEAHKKITVS